MQISICTTYVVIICTFIKSTKSMYVLFKKVPSWHSNRQYFIGNSTYLKNGMTVLTYTVLHIFRQVLFWAGKQGNHQNFEKSFEISYKCYEFSLGWRKKKKMKKMKKRSKMMITLVSSPKQHLPKDMQHSVHIFLPTFSLRFIIKSG